MRFTIGAIGIPTLFGLLCAPPVHSANNPIRPDVIVRGQAPLNFLDAEGRHLATVRALYSVSVSSQPAADEPFNVTFTISIRGAHSRKISFTGGVAYVAYDDSAGELAGPSSTYVLYSTGDAFVPATSAGRPFVAESTVARLVQPPLSAAPVSTALATKVPSAC